jgi:hypothetical protein
MVTNITNKYQNYKLWSSGFFGNKLQMWRTVDAYKESGYINTVSLRYLGDSGGMWCKFDVTSAMIDNVVSQWISEGADYSRIMVNEGALDETIALQGELLNDTFFDYFLYSTVQLKMRDALKKESKVARGLVAKHLLIGYMTPSSWSDFEVLLDQYPGHVFEVSVYNKCFGDTPGRNAVVWEIRKY